MAVLIDTAKPTLIPSNFGDLLSWSAGALKPGGPPSALLEWPDTEEGRAACRKFAIAIVAPPSSGEAEAVARAVSEAIELRRRDGTNDFDNAFDLGLDAAETVAVQAVRAALSPKADGGDHV